MADTRTITINIVSKSGGIPSDNQAKNEKDTNGELKKTLETLLHPIQSAEKSLLGKNALVYQAYNQAKSLVSVSITSTLNKRFTLKEDYLAQNTYNQIKSNISKVSGVYTSIIGGAIIGANLGPVGAGIGAVIGATGYGLSNFISYQNTLSSYNQTLNANDYSTAFSRTRAGLTNGGRGTEN